MDHQRKMAILVTTLLGGVVGLLLGFLTSSWMTVSGGFAAWMAYPENYWQWPIFGLAIGGLLSWAIHLWRPS
jgi:hypothetical protein